MSTALYQAMMLLVGAERAKLYTWHLAHVSLATHLLKCNVPAATIQALLRWQTDESLRAYARMSMADSASRLECQWLTLLHILIVPPEPPLGLSSQLKCQLQSMSAFNSSWPCMKWLEMLEATINIKLCLEHALNCSSLGKLETARPDQA